MWWSYHGIIYIRVHQIWFIFRSIQPDELYLIMETLTLLEFMASVYLIKPHIKKCPTTAIIASSPHKGQFSVYYYLHKTLWCCVFFLENEWKWLYGSCDIFQVDFLQCVRSSERKIGFCCRTLPRPPQGHHCSLGKIYEKIFGIRQSAHNVWMCQ